MATAKDVEKARKAVLKVTKQIVAVDAKLQTVTAVDKKFPALFEKLKTAAEDLMPVINAFEEAEADLEQPDED